MKIDKRKSWFWHWFVATSWRSWHKDNVYMTPIVAKYEYPFYAVDRKCPSYSTKYEADVFYRHRAIRSKNYPEYWGPYGGPKTRNNMEVER